MIQYAEGRNRGGGRTPPAFHTLAKDMSLNRGETHFTLRLRPFIILPSYYKYIYAPLSKSPSCVPEYAARYSSMLLVVLETLNKIIG